MLVLSFPRTVNPTAINQPYTWAKYVGDNQTSMATNEQQFYDTFGACYNDYTYGGLDSIEICTANGMRLAYYSFSRDGRTSGLPLPEDSKWCGFDNAVNSNSVDICNYTEAYEAYKKARLHFSQLESDAISYMDWLKSYCCFVADLSPFDLTANEQIRITVKFNTWAAGYNPFYYYNWSTSTNHLPAGITPNYSTSCILCNLYADSILRLYGEDKVEIAQLFSEVEKPVNEIA